MNNQVTAMKQTRAELTLGEMLRQRREHTGLSVRTLAAKVGFSPSFISQVENGLASPSIGSLEKIASLLDVSLSELFQPRGKAKSSVVRAKERSRVESGWSRAQIESLYAGSGSRLEPLLITLQPGASSGKTAHAADVEQFVFVVEGKIVVLLGEETTTLGKGDALTLQRGRPALWRNQSARDAKLLFVSASRAG